MPDADSQQTCPLAYTDEIRPGECKVVMAKGRSLALFNVEGRFYVTANECPHKGGPLGDGHLDTEIVTCPWHDWRFNVITGKNDRNSTVTVRTFQSFVKDGTIMVKL